MIIIGTTFWKLLVIIVREKCGLPHHINYFCSPTYLLYIIYEDKLTFVAKNTFFFLQKLYQTHNHLKMSPND